jgi:predicted DNA-binding transcriptional regulator AlpA
MIVVSPTSTKLQASAEGSHATFLTQNEVAALLRLSPRTLERHRLAGTGPVYVKLGRRVVYKREAVEAWAAANTFTSTSEAEARHD